MHSVSRQKGAVILTVAFALLFLLGFMAIALDFGHLFVVKTELQTAVDSCALSAAQELDGASDALTRASSAGMTAGNLNKVNFQGSPAGISGLTEITFSDSLIGAFSANFTPVANARYAKCTHTQSGIAPWLMQAMGAFSGDANYKKDHAVYAVAVATRSPAQSACNALPVQINPKSPASACTTSTFYGYCPGEWIPSLYNEGTNNTPPLPGYFGWANLDGSTNANETKAEVQGKTPCVPVNGNVGTPGGKVAVSTQWNSRFGLYVNGAGNPKITDSAPDTSGYSYTALNWPSKSNAIGDFLNTRRAQNRSYGDTTDTISAGNTITGLSLNNNYKDALMGANNTAPNLLSTYGQDRRLVEAPIVIGSSIQAWACLLMLHPIDGPNMTVYLEFVGDAGSVTSPCATLGLPGGTSGPLVPVLVQ